MHDETFYDKIRENIETHGQHLMGVFPRAGDTTPGFTYTIGNMLRGLPELLIIGNYGTAGPIILNRLGDFLAERGTDVFEGFLDIGLQRPLKLRRCGPRVKEDYTIQAGQFYGSEDYQVIQVLLWDKQDRYCDEPDCAAPYKCDLP